MLDAVDEYFDGIDTKISHLKRVAVCRKSGSFQNLLKSLVINIFYKLSGIKKMVLMKYIVII